jgi:predicted dehydrogenase
MRQITSNRTFMNEPQSNQTSRRQFLKTSSTAAVTGALAGPLLFNLSTRGASPGETLRVGIVGCGGRGNGALADALSSDKNAMLHAMGDIEAHKIEGGLNAIRNAVKDDTRIEVPTERRFVGLDAYEKVLQSGVDVVLLTTPPGFRPYHFKAAMEAGKHVFLEKPLATDTAGVRLVRETAAAAKQKGLAVQSGFCWRANVSRREFFKRIHDGAIGDVRSLYHTYLTSPVKPMPAASTRPAGMSDVEWQVRNWYNFVWLCGDGLVEQAVHSIDKMAWAMKDVPPLKCTAIGGRQTPNNEGNIYDHIEVNYEWANGVRGFMAQRQIPGCHSETKDYITGARGSGLLGGRRGAEIMGEKNWRYEGEFTESQLFGKMYQQEHVEFFESIRKGKPVNDGEHMCNSTLMAIMGRMAAYTGQEITWEQALNSNERLFPEKLEWDMKLPVAPIAVPGKTKFV